MMRMHLGRKKQREIKIRFLFGLCLLVLFSVAGCNKVETGNATDTAPERVLLEEEIINNRDSYFPQIATVFDGNRCGELTGFLWSGVNEQEWQALYVIDPARRKAAKVTTPQAGSAIYRAALDSRWVVWVEQHRPEKKRDTPGWALYALNRDTGQIKLIDEGVYLKRPVPITPLRLFPETHWFMMFQGRRVAG